MWKFSKVRILKTKFFLISVVSFLFGFMLSINVYPLDKTCVQDDMNFKTNHLGKSPDLIIIILSAPKNIQKRDVIRETWLKLKIRNDFRLMHYFIIGSFGLSVEETSNLNAEQSLHGDILLLPLSDVYENLTFKVLKTFVWLKEQIDYGLRFKYLLKCDDDSFVRIDSLTQELTQLEIIYLKAQPDYENLNANTSPYLKLNAQINKRVKSSLLGLYWGYFKGNAHIKSSGKWKESSWILCDDYLPYALGGGYVLSVNLVTYIANNAEYLRLFNSEDISIGTWLGPVNNILRIHDIRFDTEWKTRGCQNYHLISHSIPVDTMRKMYRNIRETGNLCEEEVILRPIYLYNWVLPPSKCCKANNSLP